VTTTIDRKNLKWLLPQWWDEQAKITDRKEIIRLAGYSNPASITQAVVQPWDSLDEKVRRQILQVLLDEPTKIPAWIKCQRAVS